MKYIFICFCVVLTACVLNEKQNNFLEFSSIPKKYFEKYSPNIENYINKEQVNRTGFVGDFLFKLGHLT